MKKNICLLSDSYKETHHPLLPPGTQFLTSYLEARKGSKYNKTVFSGLQVILKEYFEGAVVTKENIEMGKAFIDQHIGPGIFNEAGWLHILEKHGGRLPIKITAVPEGTPVSIDNVMMTIENTDPECAWLPNFMETLLLQVWYPSTVATMSRETKLLLNQYLDWTADDKSILPFQLHDFGYRGVSSVESAGLGGMAHLVNFMGTDTIRGIETAMFYYHAGMVGFSVPATEHSIMTAEGREGEPRLVGRLLKKYKKGILAMVIDSYDYMEFIRTCVREYKDEILNRDGRIVFRPDSGDPVAVSSDVINALGQGFGYTVNSKGFKVLDTHVRMLWGDGIDYNGIRSILFQLKLEGWSSENILFGEGGGLLQKLDRDTQRMAVKCSAQCRNGEWIDIQKQPRDTTKASKKGRLVLTTDGKGNWKTVRQEELNGEKNMLETVFLNGEIVRDYTFDEVRKNAAI